MKVAEFIRNNWDSCIKVKKEDDGVFLGLPYPFTVPAVGHFDSMYYWDTYFTNKGLEIDGRHEQVKNNTANILYLVDKYGFMPNGSSVGFLNRSQPPFLSLMVRDVFEHYKDLQWLKSAYETLKTEYCFWTEKRGSEIGLSHYYGTLNEHSTKDFANGFAERTGLKLDMEPQNIAQHFISIAESGWDITPRFEYESYNFAPVDLNSLLYMFEDNMAYFAEILCNGEQSRWEIAAQKRCEAMNSVMNSGNGIFLDYNLVTKKQSKILSAASFFPLFAGLATKEQAKALADNLFRLEAKHGVLTCEKNDAEGTYQWDYPNGWACLQYVAMIGLDRYGYKTEAERIARKYVTLVEKIFEETGNLWEKYNVAEGSINVCDEYKMPPMMGWSAGTYLAAVKYISK